MILKGIKRKNIHNGYTCYYCEPYDSLAGKIPLEKKIYLGLIGDFIIETYIKKRRSQASLVLQIHTEKGREQVVFDLGDITYCPFCGKKLIKEEE